MCAVLLKLLIKLPAECRCLLLATLCVYAVQDVVLVEAFEEGIAGFVAPLAVCPRWRLKGATGRLLDT